MACQDQKQVLQTFGQTSNLCRFLLQENNIFFPLAADFLRLDSLSEDVFGDENGVDLASGDDIIRNALSLTGLEGIAEEGSAGNVPFEPAISAPEKNKENAAKPVPGSLSA